MKKEEQKIDLITKYKLMVNDAMSRAMEFENPDEEISEFLRFFGEHTGCDRIYIFENRKQGKTVENTYEWCAENVSPEIENLRDVDMEVVQWWYDAFARGEKVRIPDVEILKNSSPEMYHILKVQNVRNLFVYPLMQHGEAKGFFGVDNPDVNDMDNIAIFLDVIATFIVSLILRRDTVKRMENSARLSSYAALAEIYFSMHLVDVKADTYQVVKSNPVIDANIDTGSDNSFTKQIIAVMGRTITEQYIKESLEFGDITTLQERMQNKKAIEHEFLGAYSGWCRERFIVVDYDEEGNLHHVIYAIEIIDEVKKREQHLRYLSETDLMTNIRNRGSGENKIKQLLKEGTKGLFCLVDCDRFKLFNDVYGHAVGDKILIALAKCMQDVCGSKDVVMRLGGDEFALYAPGICKMEEALRLIQRLFDKMEKLDIPELDEAKVYISLGAAFYQEDKEITFDKLYREADTALYNAKNIEGYSYCFYDSKKRYPCACCGYYTLESPQGESYEICPVCFWEDDPVQNKDPDFAGGANRVSLHKARENYKKCGASEGRILKYVRSPKEEELPEYNEET